MTIGYQAQSVENEQSNNPLDKKRERHKELSITVRRTMYVMLAYSASCGVIIAQPDLPFVLTSSGVQIPVINAAVNLKAFLLVGPLGLIAITIYLHLFLAELNRITWLDEYDKQPFLFNFQNRFSRVLAFLIFYAITPIMMVAFSWKSAVMEWRNLMYFSTVVVTAGMLFLYLKSRLKLPASLLWFIPAIFFIIVSFAGMPILAKMLNINLTRSLNLERAQLARKKLQYANLSRANLRLADLSETNLREADLWKANLFKANLQKADLHGANMFGSHLQKADLSEADLREANLIGAFLEGAYLRETLIDDTTQLNKKWRLVWELVNIEKAYWNLQETDLSAANLREADLRGAILNGAILNRADLHLAYLIEADLGRADLSNAISLTTAQLCKAETLYKTKLDPELVKKVEEQCPDLLKEPQSDLIK
jgi:uncharacterized protein YjbI with pentapeptide repeats